MEKASRQLGVKIAHVDLPNAEGVENAFRQIRAMKADALLTTPQTVARVNWTWKLLLAAIERHRLPSMFWTSPRFVEFFPGALLYFAGDTDHHPRRAATYVEKILKGAKPGDLPIERPTRTGLVVDRKVARSLGIQIPQSVLVRGERAGLAQQLVDQHRLAVVDVGDDGYVAEGAHGLHGAKGARVYGISAAKARSRVRFRAIARIA